jgi:hypothetical protein
MLERSYKLTELAKACDIPLSSLYRAAKKGELKAFTLAGAKRGKRVWASEWERYRRDVLGLRSDEPPTVASLAAAMGAEPRDAYGLADASELTGVPYDELSDEVAGRRLRLVVRDGRKVVTAEELDSWLAWSGGAA